MTLTWTVGTPAAAREFLRVPIYKSPFDPKVVALLEDLSRRLLRDLDTRSKWPDAAAFGNFIKPANLSKLYRSYARLEELANGLRVPIGRVLQFAPANVEIIAMYTWAVAVLCGCQTVVRLSSRRSEMSRYLLEQITSLAEKNGTETIWMFVDYPRDQRQISESLADSVDLVVIWGGDESVRSLRQLHTPAHSRVLPFPDRESVAIINSESYRSLGEQDRDHVVARFLKDISSFGQQACSSPRHLIWVGRDAVQDLQHDFVSRTDTLSRKSATSGASELFAKRSYIFRRAAMSEQTIRVLGKHTFFLVDESERETEALHPGHGLVSCYSVASLTEASRVLRPKDQTISQFGFTTAELHEWLTGPQLPKPQRITDFGDASLFSHVWDGKDLFYEFTRAVPIDVRI